MMAEPTGAGSAGKSSEKIAYFDCYNGISGDMALGALLDSGLETGSLLALLAGLELKGFSLETETVRRGGLAATRAIVRLEEGPAVERRLADILAILDKADLPPEVRDRSAAVFIRLAEAEAAVHGTGVEEVHFHEVGALDAIIDIVGTCAALFLLRADRVICSPLPAGRGQIHSAHGRLPLPAPATVELLKMRQAPVEGRDTGYELVTPTGAALVTTLAHSFGPFPKFNIEAVGCGAGSIDPGYANYLRVFLGRREVRAAELEEEVAIMEANIDDLNPEIYSYLMEKLLEAGALDVYYLPVQMKKNRPGVQLTVLAPPEKLKALQELMFSETTTLGYRLTTARKIMRPRAVETVHTRWGPVRIKYAPQPGSARPLHYAPEYEDCRAVAARSGLPLKEVYRLAEYLFRKHHSHPE